MACNSEQVAGQRLYYYLVANSILILAWAQLYAADLYFLCLPQIAVSLILTAIPAIGAYLSVSFLVLGKRSRLYVRHHVGWAAKMERDDSYCPKPWLWSALLREIGKDIEHLEMRCRCLQQKEKQDQIKQLLNTDPLKDFWVTNRALLPCKHGDAHSSPFFTTADLDKEIGKIPRSSVFGTSYHIALWVPGLFLGLYVLLLLAVIASLVS